MKKGKAIMGVFFDKEKDALKFANGLIKNAQRPVLIIKVRNERPNYTIDGFIVADETQFRTVKG